MTHPTITFQFPAGSIEFELYITSTMDVYEVKITSPDLEEPYEFEQDYKAFTKITEDVAKKLFDETLDELLDFGPRPNVDLGKAWVDWANDQTQEF